MESVSRRDFQKNMLGSLLTYSLLETVVSTELLGNEVRPIAAEWLKSLDQHGRELKGKKLTQKQWQEHVESLLQRIELKELLQFLDFKKLTEDVVFRERGERSLRPKFPKVEGLPTELVFGHQVFALTKGRSVVPHGHNNMATAFLVLQGDFHGRHYDRFEEDRMSMVIQPTIDKKFGPGGYSTITDKHDNVHWFKATSESGFIFNIHVLNVEAGRSSGRIYIDPRGEKLADGRIRARKLKAADAYKLYG